MKELKSPTFLHALFMEDLCHKLAYSHSGVDKSLKCSHNIITSGSQYMFILLSGTIPPVNGEEESKFVVLLNM